MGNILLPCTVLVPSYKYFYKATTLRNFLPIDHSRPLLSVIVLSVTVCFLAACARGPNLSESTTSTADDLGPVEDQHYACVPGPDGTAWVCGDDDSVLQDSSQITLQEVSEPEQTAQFESVLPEPKTSTSSIVQTSPEASIQLGKPATADQTLRDTNEADKTSVPSLNAGTPEEFLDQLTSAEGGTWLIQLASFRDKSRLTIFRDLYPYQRFEVVQIQSEDEVFHALIDPRFFGTKDEAVLAATGIVAKHNAIKPWLRTVQSLRGVMLE